MFKGISVVLVTLLAAIGIANAQTRSMDSVGRADQPGVDYDQLIENGYILFQPEGVKDRLMRAGFILQANQKAPDGTGVVYSMTAGQQVFAFGFSNCAVQGCLFMHAIHVIPTAAAGLSISSPMVNDLNVSASLGHFVAESSGDVTLRYSLPAVPECSDQCLDSHLMLFFNGTRMAHSLLQSIGNQRVASASTDDLLAFTPKGREDGAINSIATLVSFSSPYNAETDVGEVRKLLTGIKPIQGMSGWSPSWAPLVPALEPDEKIENNIAN